jgi:hypothetical protein
MNKWITDYHLIIMTTTIWFQNSKLQTLNTQITMTTTMIIMMLTMMLIMMLTTMLTMTKNIID